MIDINLGNVVTIGLISIAAYAAAKYALKMTGMSVSWL
jgi:hypothetical protein